MARQLFPSLASFGPVFLAIGFSFPPPMGMYIAIPGALMTSTALMILWKELMAQHPESNRSSPREEPSAQ